jgi:hypothetical protein
MHADVMGATVNFTNIVEDSPSGDPLPLFGQPAWAGGNSIDFDPSGNFSAVSQNGGADVTDGKLTLMVRAKPGFSLESLGLLETGLVTLLNLGGNDPFAAVTGLVDIDVVEVDGGAIQQVNLPPLSLTYSPSNGDFQHSVDAAGPLYSSPWTGTLAVDLDAALTAAGIGYTFGATKINITLNNRLLAATGALGSIAIIDKKDFDITVTTEPVPEPATALLMLAASLGVLLLRERCRWN